MVVKTDLCAFSETRVFPGHGTRFVTRTGQLVVLSTSKVSAMFHQRKKPAKLYWTQASRRMHKKLNQEASIKKRARRVVKLQRGFVGAENLEELKKKSAPAVPRPAAAAGAGAGAGAAGAKKPKVVQAAVAEAKARRKAALAAKAAAGGKGGAAPKAAAAAKHAGKGR